MKRFGLNGAAGYIALRHIKAIKETNNDLKSAYVDILKLIYDGFRIRQK